MTAEPSGTLTCRTRQTVFDIFAADPPPMCLVGCFACRLVPVLVTLGAMLLETEFIIAVALAIPNFVR